MNTLKMRISQMIKKNIFKIIFKGLKMHWHQKIFYQKKMATDNL